MAQDSSASSGARSTAAADRVRRDRPGRIARPARTGGRWRRAERAALDGVKKVLTASVVGTDALVIPPLPCGLGSRAVGPGAGQVVWFESCRRSLLLTGCPFPLRLFRCG